MSDTKTISEVLAEMKAAKNTPKLVRDWKTMIPQGSQWFPGCPGNPACKECDGRGFLRLDGLPIGHPYFGRIILCDCVRGRKVQAQRLSPPEDPPFMDDPLEQEKQTVFDTGEEFKRVANMRSIR